MYVCMCVCVLCMFAGVVLCCDACLGGGGGGSAALAPTGGGWNRRYQVLSDFNVLYYRTYRVCCICSLVLYCVVMRVWVGGGGECCSSPHRWGMESSVSSFE